MSQKKSDLEKSKLLKAQGKMKLANAANRQSGDQAVAATDRRERRRLDQAKGLVPFAVKLPEALIGQLHSRAAAENVPLQDLVAKLLEKALASPQGTSSGA